MDAQQKAALNFTDTKEYFEASPDQRNAAKERGFEIAVGNSEEYKSATPEIQDAMHTKYVRYMDHLGLQSEHNPTNIARAVNQDTVDNSGFWKNTWDKAKESVETSAIGTRITDDAMIGADVDPNFGRDTSAYGNKLREKVMTAPQKELAKDITTFNKRREKDGFWNDALAWGQLAVDVVTNPKAVIQTGAESASSLVAGFAGGKTAAMGAAGLTAATGGAAAPLAPFITGAGMAAGSMAEAIPHQFYSEIEEQLKADGLDVTEFNVNKFVKDNPEKLKQAQKDAVVYSGVIGLVDAVTGHLITKIAALPQRAARKSAAELIKKADNGLLKGLAEKTGKSVDELIDGAIDIKAAEIMKARPATAKFKNRIGQYVGEVASEPISEAAGTAAIGNENTAENLIYETIGGIGAGPISTAVDVSAFGSKLATDKASKTAKNILIPKTKAEKARSKEIKEQRKTTKNQMKADRAYGYKKEVAETSPDADLSALSDPKSPDYNPIKAMDILAKSDDPQRYDDAMALRATTKAAVVKTRDKLAELEEIEAEGKLTQRQHDEHTELTKLAEDQYALALKVKEKSDILHSNIEKSASAVEATPIENPETATEQEVAENVTKTFGSSSSAAMTNEKIEKAINSPNISSKTKTELKAIQSANIAIEKVAQAHESSSKSLDDVKFDVAEGTDEFKGINNYKRSIAHATRTGNTERATSEIASLEKFSKAHRQKANVFQAVFDSERLGKPLSKENADAYAKMQKANPDLNIHKGSKRLIEVVNMEADALEKSVDSAKAYVSLAATSNAIASSEKGPKGADTVTQTEKAGPSIPSAKKSPETPSTASETTTVKGTTVSNDRIATGFIAATQIADNTGDTEWLERQVASGFLDKDQTAQAQATIAKAKKKATEKKVEPKQKTESAALVTPKTKEVTPQQVWENLDKNDSRNVRKLIGGKAAAVEQAIKKHSQGKKLGKRQQAVIDALLKKSAPEEVSSSEETSEVTSANAVENLQAVDAPTKQELVEDDFEMTEQTYGEFEIQIVNDAGETESVSFNKAMQDLNEEKNMLLELRKCLTS